VSDANPDDPLILLDTSSFRTLQEHGRRIEQYRRERFVPPPIPDADEQGLIPVANWATTTCPQGGLLQLLPNSDSNYWDGQHYGCQQPQYPGISQTLLVACSAIAGHGGTGLAWQMDQCLHPIADPDGIMVVNSRYGSGSSIWTPLQSDLGPITCTQTAANSLAQGFCHGNLGDEIVVVSPNFPGGYKSFKGILAGLEISVTQGSVPGDFSGSQS
jgi:hypothetical protein